MPLIHFESIPSAEDLKTHKAQDLVHQ